MKTNKQLKRLDEILRELECGAYDYSPTMDFTSIIIEARKIIEGMMNKKDKIRGKNEESI